MDYLYFFTVPHPTVRQTTAFFVLSFLQRCNSYDVIHTFGHTKATFIAEVRGASASISLWQLSPRVFTSQRPRTLISKWIASGKIIRQSARAYMHVRVTSVGQRYSHELLEL